jgi:hypothetical protein
VLVNPTHILGLSVPRWVLCVRAYACICVVDPGCVVYTSLVTALVSIGWRLRSGGCEQDRAHALNLAHPRALP